MRLRLLPPHFARRKENTSVFDFKERVVKWKVGIRAEELKGPTDTAVV